MTSRRHSLLPGGRAGRQAAGRSAARGQPPRHCPAAGPGGLKLFRSRSSSCPLGDAGGSKAAQPSPAQPSPAWAGTPSAPGQETGRAAMLSRRPLTACASHHVFASVELKGNALGPSGLLPALAGLLFAGSAGDSGAPASCRVITRPAQGLQLLRHPCSSGTPAPRHPCSSAPLLLGTPAPQAPLPLGIPAPWHPCSSGTPCPLASLCSDSLPGVPTGHTALPGVTAPLHKQPPETALFRSALALAGVLCLGSRKSLMPYLPKSVGFPACFFLPS